MNSMQGLKHFLDSEGRLRQLPVKRKLKIAALFYLSKKFEPGVIYTERQVGEILDTAHTFNDRCLLRRELYNLRLLDREPAGSRYRLSENPPEPSAFRLEDL